MKNLGSTSLPQINRITQACRLAINQWDIYCKKRKVNQTTQTTKVILIKLISQIGNTKA